MPSPVFHGSDNHTLTFETEEQNAGVNVKPNTGTYSEGKVKPNTGTPSDSPKPNTGGSPSLMDVEIIERREGI